MKKAVVVFLVICLITSFLCGAVFAASEDETLSGFLLEQGITCSKNSTIRVVTNEDDSQHIEISEMIFPGFVQLTMVSCIGEANGELVSIKLFPDAQPGTVFRVENANRASNGFSEQLGSTHLTVTMTAYYTSVFVWSPESAVLYAPSGVTGKITRSSGSATATSFYGYFTIPGKLATSNYTITNTEYNYIAQFSVDNPYLNTVYSNYATVPSGYSYIWPYPSSSFDSPGLGFSIEVAGYSHPFEYSVNPLN